MDNDDLAALPESLSLSLVGGEGPDDSIALWDDCMRLRGQPLDNEDRTQLGFHDAVNMANVSTFVCGHGVPCLHQP
jgi:hypothetical protein